MILNEELKITHAVTTSTRLASIGGANPEIGRARVHEQLEVRRGCTHLNGRNVTNVVSLNVKTKTVVARGGVGCGQTAVGLRVDIDLRNASARTGGSRCGGGSACIGAGGGGTGSTSSGPSTCTGGGSSTLALLLAFGSSDGALLPITGTKAESEWTVLCDYDENRRTH